MNSGATRGRPVAPGLSVVVTAHAEGRLLRPTLRSIAAAAAELPADAGPCELLVVLDNPSPETAAEARTWEQRDAAFPGPVRLIDTGRGDAGAARNIGAQNARGRYVAFIDGDDLITSNYLAKGLAMLEEQSEPVILHPGLVVGFGARSTIWRIPATDAVDHLQLIRDNLWPSSSMSLRTTYLDIPYRVAPPETGFGPEDWFWNIETSIAGIPHRPVPGTMFFYRVRKSGGVNNRHLSSILPAFDIDRLKKALPQQTSGVAATRRGAPRARSTRVLPKPRTLLKLGYRTVRPIARLLLRSVSQGDKERLYAWVTSLPDRRQRPKRRSSVPPAILDALRAAAEIEPAISWTAADFEALPEWTPSSDHYASMLVSLIDQLRGARGLVLVPWVGIGGADIVSLNYARALSESVRFDGAVAILATHTPSRTLRHLIPDGVRLVQVPTTFRSLTPDQQRRLLAQLIILLGPELVISVNCFDMSNSLQLFGRQLGGISRILLTLFAFDRIGAGFPTNPITDDAQRPYLDDIEGIVTDNTVTAATVREMLALDEKVRVHHQPALQHVPSFRTGTRAYTNSYFSASNPFVVVWPHRLDKEKRPEALIAIADGLREAGLPVRIEVYGQQVLSTGGKALMASLRAAGVVYRGPYSGGLEGLPTEDYHALLLTSESEGLPLVVVQSMLLGIPVIATRVGGVTDIIRDGETGLLVSGPDDAEGFVAALHRLMDSREERRRIIHNAYDLAVAQHSWDAFRRLVEQL